MIKKRLFNDDETYNEEGLAFSNEIKTAIRPIIQKYYYDLDFSIRDMAHIGATQVWEDSLIILLDPDRLKGRI